LQLNISSRDKLTRLLARHPWIAVSVSGTLASSIYTIAAHSPLSDPAVIRASAMDAAVPFLPWAAWPYATYVLVLPTLVLLASRLVAFERVLVAAMSTALSNAAVYLAWPTQLEMRTDAPAGTLLALIQRLDTTLCALPSGHVSLPMAIATAALLVSFDVHGHVARRWQLLSAFFLMWTIVLAASTLLTRQHYVVDAAAGAAFGMLVGIIAAARRFTSPVGAPESAHASGSQGRLDSVCGRLDSVEGGYV
jgi:membrane-associated phospholipid phosphatase